MKLPHPMNEAFVMKWKMLFATVLWLMLPSVTGAQSPLTLEDFDSLVSRLQTVAETGDQDGFLSLLAPDADREAGRQFALTQLRDIGDRTAVVARFLIPAEEEETNHELLVEIFTETGDRARLQTWSLGVTEAISPQEPAASDTPLGTENTRAWVISGYRAMDSIDTLHHLRLNAEKQFDAENVVVAGEDMTLQMSSGAVFVAEVEAGITGLVLVGEGVMTFDPAPESERRQVEIFSGSEALQTSFTHAFVRVNPTVFSSRVSPSRLTETPVDSQAFNEAQELFATVSEQSYTVNLSDLSDRTWWLTPTVGHFQVEVSTEEFGLLTYAQAQNQPEDITLYQRDPAYKIISLYPSARQRTVQGKYYDDRDSIPYDILDYDVVASFEPAGVNQESLSARAELEGCWIIGTTRLAVEVTGLNFNNLTLQLADELNVQSVTSREFGPMLFFRMGGRNNLVISLPDTAPIGTEFSVTIAYSGLLPAQAADENWLGTSRRLYRADPLFGIGERRYIYSGATAWYPQGVIPDFATATMELTVPADYGVIASGEARENNLPLAPRNEELGPKTYRFITLQPARYLSAVISRFWPHETPTLDVVLDSPVTMPAIRSGVIYDGLELAVETNPRSSDQVEEYYARAQDILDFYGSLVGDLPYPTFTLALTDSVLPGGHSPAYFAILNQPLPVNPGEQLSWGGDPVAFNNTDHFFLAHELAHQWWGQAIGWKNYHEQWLSEALAQYFAALYVQKDAGDSEFLDVLEQMRRWSMRHSDEGPVYLGFRLGHIESDAQVYRALVYNKGAMVLHMLRRLIGDDAFFDGLRHYYGAMRFRSAGTDDLIRAFETQAARSLEDFFDPWIHGSELPNLNFKYRTEESGDESQSQSEVILAFEQIGPLFEVPVTVTLRYRSGARETTIVPVTDRLTEVRVPLSGQLRDIDINEDDVMLGEVRQ